MPPPPESPFSPIYTITQEFGKNMPLPPAFAAFYHPAYDHEEYPSELIDNDILLFPSDQNTQNPRRKGIKYWLFKTTADAGNPFEPVAPGNDRTNNPVAAFFPDVAA